MPTVLDIASADEAHDIFGRERFSQHRDDMGGVGSFNSETWPVDGENVGIVFYSYDELVWISYIMDLWDNVYG